MPKSTSQFKLNSGSLDYDLDGDFIVIYGDYNFSQGEILKLYCQDHSPCPVFISKTSRKTATFRWRSLSVAPVDNPLCKNCFHVVEGKGECPVCYPKAPTSIKVEEAGPLSNDPLVNPKKAAGAVKAPMHTLPTLAMIQMANVMAGGAFKYGFHNFRESKIDAQTYIGAINRHFLKWQDGVDFDEESGQHELAHVMACCAILIDAHFTDGLIDNRSKTGLVEDLLKKSEQSFEDFVCRYNKGKGESSET